MSEQELYVDVLLELGQTSELSGDITIDADTNAQLDVIVQKYNGTSWDTLQTLGPYTKDLVSGVGTDIKDFGDVSYTPDAIGVYRWVATLTVGADDSIEYTYFEVTQEGFLQAPLLVGQNLGDGANAKYIITESDSEATNRIFIRKENKEFSDTPDLTILGNGNKTITLGKGVWYAKVLSVKGSFSVGGQKDPVKLEIRESISEEDQESSSGETKNISNVEIESITNPFYGNQFIGYFLKVPQVGYYQDPTSRSLKPYLTDRVNESIKGVQLPETSIPMIGIPYFGHQNEQYMGVGDGELGQISVRFLLDRYLQNYTSLLNWSYLKYDWTFGGKNPDEGFSDRDLHGTFIVQFLDADEERTRKIGYKVIIDSLPGLSLAVDTPDEVVFEVMFRVLDIDTSQFVMGSPLSERVVIHQANSPIVKSLT